MDCGYLIWIWYVIDSANRTRSHLAGFRESLLLVYHRLGINGIHKICGNICGNALQGRISRIIGIIHSGIES